MTQSFNIGDLSKLAQRILQEHSNGQEFMLYDVYKQTREAYERFPEDPVIRQVAFVIEKMAEKARHGTTITQSQLSKIYNEFVRLAENSKFKMVLGHLLLNNVSVSNNTNEKFVKGNRLDADTNQITNNDLVNEQLTGILGLAFDNPNSYKAYDQKLAEKGKEYVKLELNSIGFKNPNVEIVGGNTNTLVYASHFDTAYGIVTVAIPIDLRNNKLVLPSTFVANDCLKELNATNIKDFIEKKSELRDFKVPNTKDILAAVGILTGKNNYIGEEEFNKTAIGFQDTNQMNIAAPNLFVDKKYEDPRPYIDTTPNVEMPKELAHIARDFEDSILEAVSLFGKEAVNSGKQMVTSELVLAGFKNAQVKFGSESQDTAIYLASINTPKGSVEIEIPVEMKLASGKYIPLIPTYFAYDGLLEDFTASKLQRFAINLPAPSVMNKVHVSSYSYMLLPELRDEIIKAASDNDYVTCETVLNHIEDNFSDEDYKNSIADYQYLLMTKAKVAKKEQHKCSKLISAGKGSLEPRCGHLLLPLNKVIVDEFGNCRPKVAIEREKLNPISESSAAISTSKINFT